MNKVMITAREIAKVLQVSQSKAYQITRQLNLELSKKNFLTVCGKVPRQYFEERMCIQLGDESSGSKRKRINDNEVC